MKNYFKLKLGDKSVDATILKQRKLIGAVIPAESLSRTVPLSRIRKYWTHFEVPEQERRYAAHTLATSQGSELGLEYCDTLKRLAQLRRDAEFSLEQLQEAKQNSDEMQAYIEIEVSLLQYFRALNSIRTLTEECVDHCLREHDAISEVCQLMPERPFFENILQKCGLDSKGATEEIDAYWEQTEGMGAQRQSLFLLLGEEVPTSYFPYNYSSLVYTRLKQPFDGKICPFAAELVFDEELNQQRQLRRRDKFVEINATQCIVPIRPQSQLFDLYSTKEKYVTKELGEKVCEVAEFNDTESISASLTRSLQQPASKLPFHEQYMQYNIKQHINDQLQVTTTTGEPFEDFKEYYELFHIPVAEAAVIDGLCQQQRYYVTFMQNCTELKQYISDYKSVFEAFQEAITSENYRLLPELCQNAADVIDRARKIVGRPIQLPTLRAGFDVLLLQFENIRQHLNDEIECEIGANFMQILESEGNLQDKYQRDMELVQQNNLLFLTIRVDASRITSIFRPVSK